MIIEEDIIKVGMEAKIKISQLWKPANACFENPDTGLEIKHATVKHVIKDCALMAKSYIPVEVFCKLKDPIGLIRGNIDAIELKQFATQVSDGKMVNKRVLYSMIFDYRKPETVKVKPRNIEDVYGDFTKLGAASTIGAVKSYTYTEVVLVLEGLLL